MTHAETTNREKTKALAAVLDSDLFVSLERLRDFLTYVVEEELAGRGDAIRGKTIAQDVYDRNPLEGDDPENVVRVDARRMRQSLAFYYETVGARDPVRIHMHTGSYRPHFEKVEVLEEAPRRQQSFFLPVVTCVVGAVTGIAITLLVSDALKDPVPPPVVVSDVRGVLERQAILGKSPTSLQAVNLAEQARAMIFPIFDRSRQQLVTEVFRRVIELDSDYFGGYAGAAHTLGTLAILTPQGKAKNELLAASRQMAREAERLEPAHAWTQSARAWSSFANRNYAEAQQFSRRAAELGPEDGNILDIYGTIALFSGDFSSAVTAADKAREKGRSNQRFANRSIFAAASFHLGNFEQSLEAFQTAADYGDPISAPSFAFQAAGLYALGRTDEALRKIAELNAAWPGANLSVMLYGIYQHPEHVEQLLGHLIKLGWSQKSDPGKAPVNAN